MKDNTGNKVTAINKEYQTTVNQIIAWNIKYDAAVDEESMCLTDREISRCEAKQARAYDKLYELFKTLPEREKKNIRDNIDTLRTIK